MAVAVMQGVKCKWDALCMSPAVAGWWAGRFMEWRTVWTELAISVTIPLGIDFCLVSFDTEDLNLMLLSWMWKLQFLMGQKMFKQFHIGGLCSGLNFTVPTWIWMPNFAWHSARLGSFGTEGLCPDFLLESTCQSPSQDWACFDSEDLCPASAAAFLL